MVANFSKLDKFERVDFRRWHKKMHFLFSTMSVVCVLNTQNLDDGDDVIAEQIRRKNKWNNDDYVCRGIILNGTSNSLFDIYQNVECEKELWDSLEAKYMAGDASNFKHTLKHKKEELTLVELGSHLRIEESLEVQHSDKPKSNNLVGPSVVNMVEHNNSIGYNDNKGKPKHRETKNDPNKKSKVTCWKCEKLEHLKKDCKGGKVGNKVNDSSTNSSLNDSSNSRKGHNMFNKSFQVYFVTYVFDANFVQDDDVAWLVDSGATVHVCKDRCWFKNYELLNNASILHMRNESTT
uniref:Zinc finger, CCHC-type n=1 Tax=Tanacetum cinerariifolium TaxID=118510 RepID=A0A6L2LM88_TANCI|nr:zinc finger, CCHC-type [Tanacetum cinerariifolium]